MKIIIKYENKVLLKSSLLKKRHLDFIGESNIKLFNLIKYLESILFLLQNKGKKSMNKQKEY